jgi:hypothetical protein
MATQTSASHAISHPSTASPGLDLDFDQELSRWGCRAARVAWMGWGAIIVAALFGLLGDGPLSGARAKSSDDAVAVTYKRFVHYHHPEEVTFNLQPHNGTSNTISLTLNAGFLDSVQIDRIDPIPIRSRIGSDEVTFVFERSSTEAPTQIVFHLQYNSYGKVQGSAKVDDDDPVRFVQTVYP